MAEYLDENNHLIKDKNILELGSGSGLPSIITSLNQAKMIIATDYPDPEVLNNIQFNIKENIKNHQNIKVEGYLWGSNPENLLNHINNDQFDLILMADLIFNHTEHKKMLKTASELLKKDGQILVFFSHHRPQFVQRDLKFLELAKNDFGFKITQLPDIIRNVMFEEDPGDEKIRKTIYRYILHY